MSDIGEAFRKLDAEALISTWEASLRREDQAAATEGLDEETKKYTADKQIDEADDLYPPLRLVITYLHDAAIEDGFSEEFAEGILSGIGMFVLMIGEQEKQQELIEKLGQ